MPQCGKLHFHIQYLKPYLQVVKIWLKLYDSFRIKSQCQRKVNHGGQFYDSSLFCGSIHNNTRYQGQK